jgi:hypothetical protein
LGLRIGLGTLETEKSLGTAGNQKAIPRISISYTSRYTRNVYNGM